MKTKEPELVWRRVRWGGSDLRITTVYKGTRFIIANMSARQFHMTLESYTTYANFSRVGDKIYLYGNNVVDAEILAKFRELAKIFVDTIQKTAHREQKRLKMIQRIERRRELIRERKRLIESSELALVKELERLEETPRWVLEVHNG